MNSVERVCLSRVRLLVLDRIVDAGGRVRLEQVRRAVAPVAGLDGQRPGRQRPARPATSRVSRRRRRSRVGL